ncbi:hypothetical protein CFOL_v3_19571 [Cephalotus follicularis]|uniref:Hydroxyproline-rich glycoprotein family protein n=1 Tax=Cephalotus follicularis TaxID=3775 RepID=A0A1Q3C732_CEPFO|nr:hypothetical protein CFOL_v3_19571 [Cephalotus follicularis]
MRNGNGDSRVINSTFETINAAATAIASAENRVPRASIQKRRWGSCWSIYWCFGSHKHRKRIGHAILVPETTAPGTDSAQVENPTQAPAPVFPFVAPPSSPASFLQSEPPSATQSPVGLLSISANMYSPSGPASIFAIGPYAHETQLVSPPVFSTFTTEPSTAPFTPPPESVHLTTPSSPEVPFARLLDPNLPNGDAVQRFPLSHYEFQSYQLQPGSPVGQLISPSSGISGSGTSSPFPDGEFATCGPHFPEFRIGEPPRLFNLDKWGSRQGSGSLTPDAVRSTPRNGFLLDRQTSDISSLRHLENVFRNDHMVAHHRVSFELTTGDVVRCVEKKPIPLALAVSEPLQNGATVERGEKSNEKANHYECHVGEASDKTSDKAPSDEEEAPRQQKHRSITLGSVKEFNFDNADGGDSCKPNVSSDWWANEKAVGKENETIKNWSFFPMMQPGVS